MLNITLTEKQNINLVKLYNTHVKIKYRLTPSKAYLLIGNDNFDSAIEEDGCYIYEVGKFLTRSGNPETFDITDKMVTIETLEDDYI